MKSRTLTCSQKTGKYPQTFMQSIIDFSFLPFLCFHLICWSESLSTLVTTFRTDNTHAIFLKKIEWRRKHELCIIAFISIICVSFARKIKIFGDCEYGLKIYHRWKQNCPQDFFSYIEEFLIEFTMSLLNLIVFFTN